MKVVDVLSENSLRGPSDNEKLEKLVKELDEATHWSEFSNIIERAIKIVALEIESTEPVKKAMMKIILAGTKFVLESSSGLRHRAAQMIITDAETLMKKFVWSELKVVIKSLSAILKEGFGEEVLDNYKKYHVTKSGSLALMGLEHKKQRLA